MLGNLPAHWWPSSRPVSASHRQGVYCVRYFSNWKCMSTICITITYVDIATTTVVSFGYSVDCHDLFLWSRLSSFEPIFLAFWWLALNIYFSEYWNQNTKCSFAFHNVVSTMTNILFRFRCVKRKKNRGHWKHRKWEAVVLTWPGCKYGQGARFYIAPATDAFLAEPCTW